MEEAFRIIFSGGLKEPKTLSVVYEGVHCTKRIAVAHLTCLYAIHSGGALKKSLLLETTYAFPASPT